MRAYDFASLSPVISAPRNGLSPNGAVGAVAIGGNIRVVDAEVEVPLIRQVDIRGGVFDVGNLCNTESSIAGIGFWVAKYRDPCNFRPTRHPARQLRIWLRWFSPVGPLRFSGRFPSTDAPANGATFIFAVGDPF